jgi:predicted Rossmann fold flavoprotein
VPDSGSTNSLPVVIIGGGAAGMFAAITCAEANPHRRVIVLEKGASLLAKVRISGGGRCNVTHACFDPKQLVKNYPRGSRELLGPFHRWQPRDTVAWFASRGVPLKTEEDGRMFPVTDSSQTIVDCLLNSAKRAGVEVRLGVGLVAARPTTCETTPVPPAAPTSGGFELELSDGSSLACSRLLIAASGLKPGPLMELIKSFGHTITPLAPSLFTVHVRDPRINGLMGLSVPHAEASIPGTKFTHQGPLLITHWGLSGPAILKLSAWAACWAQERDYRFTVRLNWSGASEQDAGEAIESARKNFAGRQVRKASLLDLPTRLWERLVSAAGIPDLMPWSQLRREQASALVTQFTACDLPVTGKSMFKEEFVTSGGVALKEIDFKTMGSRLVPGLHFAGEVLDIDGVTGGFNFQAAWTGGRLAGLAMAE